MKTWKTIALSVITTSALVTGGALTYSYLQPSHYKGDTFTNEKTISSTTTSSSVSSSNTTESTTNSNTNTNPVYTESTTNEQLEQRGGTCLGQTPSNQETNNNAYNQTPTLTRDIVESYAGCNYQEAIIQLKNNYGITGAVTETVETSDFKDNVIICASYENNMVYFKIAKHIDTNPYLPVGPEPSEEIKSETNE